MLKKGDFEQFMGTKTYFELPDGSVRLTEGVMALIERLPVLVKYIVDKVLPMAEVKAERFVSIKFQVKPPFPIEIPGHSQSHWLTVQDGDYKNILPHAIFKVCAPGTKMDISGAANCLACFGPDDHHIEDGFEAHLFYQGGVLMLAREY